MILSLSAQAAVFLWMAAAGAASGLLFDLFRALRRVWPHHDALTWLEDLLFWMLVFLVVFGLIIRRNGGEMRAFLLLGLALGTAVYFAGPSKIVLAALVAVGRFVNRVLYAALRILTWPVRFLRRVLRVPVAFCRKIVKKRLFSAKKVLHMARICVKMRIVGFTRDARTAFKKV